MDERLFDHQLTQRTGRWLWAAVDVSVWVFAVVLAFVLRVDFSLVGLVEPGTVRFVAAAMLAQLVVGALVGPYAVGHDRGSFEEIVDLSRTVLIVGIGLFAWALLTKPPVVPRSVPVIASALAVLAMFAVRFAVRSWRTNTNQRGSRRARRRAVVFGAGYGARLLLRSMDRDAASDLHAVALLDDDRAKHRLRIQGVRVRGGRDQLSDVATRLEASVLVIAIPSANATLIRDLTERATQLNMDVRVLPSISEIFGRPTMGDLRDVDLEDLLGRHAIQLDNSQIAAQISGARVLVTGAGGSIGSELCRQIARFGPAKLYLLDRDESGLQATQLSLSGHGLLNGEETLLADIREPEALSAVMARAQPEIVFHAAALKHLPLLEAYPLEAWKTNVVGTMNVLRAAREAGARTVVNISTDKAANPTCALGYSKRIAERLTAGLAAQDRHTRYVSVRFGNVLGSRGSVVHAFTAQIERGGPITVTHPDVQRYFMLIPEACQLVLEAATIGADGDVMVLDMGEQVHIDKLARTLIRLSGRQDVDIVYTGLRPGEKLLEELFFDVEARSLTTNPLVTRVGVPGLAEHEIRAAPVATHDQAKDWMRFTCDDGRAASGLRSPGAGLPLTIVQQTGNAGTVGDTDVFTSADRA